jgi:cytochrome P450
VEGAQALVSFFSEEFRRDPYPTYAMLRGASPVLHEPQSGAWLVLDYDGVKRTLHDQDAFASAVSPEGGPTSRWLIFMDPPRHGRLRALVAKAFTPRVVEALEPRVRTLSSELIDAVIARGSMDLVADYAAPLPMLVIAEMLGVPVADRPRFLRWTDAMLGLAQSVSGEDGAPGPAFAAATSEMADYVGALIGTRRTAPTTDLLSGLVHATVDGERLTDDEILGFFQVLLVAGSETTTNLIDNAVIDLLDHPAELARLRAAPALVPSAIEEVLRHRSPGQAMFRRARRDVVLHDRTIPAGSLVLAMIGAANRDPARFAEPDRFDVGRDPNPHLAFGQGAHFCLGAPLSRLEGRIALGHLLERLQDIGRASDAPWEPRRAFHVHGPSHLPIRFRPGRRA